MAVHRRSLLVQVCFSALGFALGERATAQTVSYTYDELGRIKTALYSNGATITYSYDAAGNRTQVVQVPGSTAPTGTFSASPTSISSGGSSTLSWTGTNATSASINNDVGAVTPVAGGSVSVSPSVTTTYTLTLTGPGGTITKQATVTVTGTGGFNQTIQITGTGPVNLRTLANSAGYNGAQATTIIFQVGSAVAITGAAGSANVAGGRGIDTGTWPSSTYSIALTLQVSGKVYGGGGAGAAGWAGSAGGEAVYCQENIAITVNAGGQVKGGGGGGGYGEEWDHYVKDADSGQYVYVSSVAGGAGGGGFPNGPGANNGTTSGGGAGGAGQQAPSGSSRLTGAGGNGGGAAAAGAAGSVATGAETTGGLQQWLHGIIGPLPGGAAGYAIRKNGNTVSVTNNGAITGTVG